MILTRRASLALPLLAVTPVARAQSALPKGPLKIVVGFAAGGTADLAGRVIADKLRERTGLSVIVDNKPGISGVIATEAVAKSPPDGNTLMLAVMTSTVMGKLTFVKLPYDPQKDLAPVSLVSTFQIALAVAPSNPAKDMKEFVAWAKANPAQANFGVPAMGGHSHFFGLLLGKTLGLDMQPVPYKGAAPMVNDMGGGQVQIGISGLADLLASHKGGKVRILGTSGAARALSSPDLPTFSEQGYPGLQGDGWFGLFAPAGTPPATVEALNREVDAVLKLPDVRERIVTMGMDPRGGAPGDLARFEETEMKRWAPIVAASGFKVE
jgi:tripartite-type tricarboxylate transporter receptor subunit TctC